MIFSFDFYHIIMMVAVASGVEDISHIVFAFYIIRL